MFAFPGDDAQEQGSLKRDLFFFLRRYLPGLISPQQPVFWRYRAPVQLAFVLLFGI